MQAKKKIYREAVENHSGGPQAWERIVPRLKRNHYFVDKGLFPGGDQPKNFIWVYEYRRNEAVADPKWQGFIAKFPRKWFPVESITEQLLTRIGQLMKMNIADSRLAILNGQLRFLSKNFLKRNRRLVHGAEIYSAYLNDDEFVKQIDREKKEKEFFDYEFARKAIMAKYPGNCDSIVMDFTRMLIFDCFVGLNDRHFYNWGVIEDLKGRHAPRFAPLFDNARGLFWNYAESEIARIANTKGQKAMAVNKYVGKSVPKIPIGDLKNPTHFDFLTELLSRYPEFSVICSEFLEEGTLASIILMLNTEFSGLLSKERREVIQHCLEQRFLKINRIVEG